MASAASTHAARPMESSRARRLSSAAACCRRHSRCSAACSRNLHIAFTILRTAQCLSARKAFRFCSMICWYRPRHVRHTTLVIRCVSIVQAISFHNAFDRRDLTYCRKQPQARRSNTSLFLDTWLRITRSRRTLTIARMCHSPNSVDIVRCLLHSISSEQCASRARRLSRRSRSASLHRRTVLNNTRSLCSSHAVG
eukprot:PhM_4_TR16642/c0_g1_i1/m.12877